jgi:hypothetical protein
MVYNIGMINFNLKNTTKYIAFAIMLIAMLPTIASAAKSGGSDYGYDGGWGDSGSGYYSSDYYSPSYTDSVGYDSYGGGWGDSGSGYYSSDYYTPSYGGDYSSPSYGGGYGGSSYGGSSLGGYSYTPSYGGSYGSTYSGPSYGGSSIPSTSYSSSASNSNPNVSTVATGGNSNAVATGGSASSSNTNVNNNVNNVYVYTTPTGNAVTYNPQYQRLDGYCTITPTNPRVGQTVTATAYITGGVGSYTYTWGGDLSTSASGVSTSFTSYSAGTKNITVTARSGQDVVTKSCTVTFEGTTSVYNSYNYGSTVTTGTPVSGVFIQPGQIKSGTAISGVYLNDLPATGMDLGWMEYTIGFMTVVLASVAIAISKAKKSFVHSTRE